MTDLETRLRSLADAAAAVAVQPTMDELGLVSRRQVPHRSWVVGVAAAAAAAVVTVAVVQPWTGRQQQLGTPAPTVVAGATCETGPVAYIVSDAALPADTLAATVRARVEALTADGCVTTSPDGSVSVHLGAASRAAVTLSALRGEAWMAPVTSACPATCVATASGPTYKDAAYGMVYTVDASRRIDLGGHLRRAFLGPLNQSATDWSVNLELDDVASQAFGSLTAELVNKKSPGNQLAIVVSGAIVSAPVIQSAITDGNAQVTGNFNEQQARRLAAELSAPSIPSDATIRIVSSGGAGPTPGPSLSTPVPSLSTPVSSGLGPVPPEGARPPMPSSGVRGTNTDDPNGVYAAQVVLDAYAEELRRASGVVDSVPTPKWVPGWCGVGIDATHDGVILWWKGTPSSAVLAVLARAKAGGVTPEIVNTKYDQQTLQPTVAALMKHMSGGKPINSLHVANDCSGVEVGLDAMSAPNEAQVAALAPEPNVPLLFQPRVDATPW